MNKCENCGYLHYRTDPCRAAKKSTATRTDVSMRQMANASEVNAVAGTQALPVDTNSSIVENEDFRTFTSKNDVADTSAGTVLDKDRKPKFDKVAYQRNYMRTYRAKKKEAEK